MQSAFSKVSQLYAESRPLYPDELVSTICKLCANHKLAWDCGTGNGQAARSLILFFEKVYASDISSEQLSFAFKHPRIEYFCGPAENSGFGDNIFDLVTVAEAVHWFNPRLFQSEVLRVLKPEGVLATWHYDDLIVDNPMVEKCLKLLRQTVQNEWSISARRIREPIMFDAGSFEPICCKQFSAEQEWQSARMVKNVLTWSAVQAFKEKHSKNESELRMMLDLLQESWGDSARTITFNIFLNAWRRKL